MQIHLATGSDGNALQSAELAVGLKWFSSLQCLGLQTFATGSSRLWSDLRVAS